MKQKHYKNLVLAAIILLMPMIGWAQTYSVTTLAGSGANGTANGTGTAAEFDNPTSAVVDGSGNIFVTDRTNDVIRKITPAGVVSTFAGSGTAGFANGTGTAAQFNNPHGIAIDASGNLYVADRDNHNIRKITSAGVVTTLAGSITGQTGTLNATGTAARFNQPTGVAVDASGNVFVTDYNNHRIRRVTAAGVVTTFAGTNSGSTNATGTSASFNLPAAIAIDGSGNLYVADRNNHRIRKITTAAVVTTLAGSTNGNINATGTAARFDNPRGIAVDASGNVYVADNTNNLIRMVTSAGVVTTLAGSGTAALTNGIGTAAAFDRPMGVAVDASGNIYVAEEGNDVIRKIYPCNLTTPTIAGATSFCSGSSTTLTTTYTLGTDEAYLWSDNSSASTLSVTAAGTYSLRIRNTVTGCTSSASTGITVSVTTLPSAPTITGTSTICSGSNTTLTTSTTGGNVAYLWSTGETTQSISVSTAGTYTLRIRNTTTGCTSAASTGITVTVNALPTTPTITGGTSICTGGNTTLTTTATLGTNEAYLWSNGITTQSTTVSTAGTYSLRIRNTVTGCTSAVSNAITTVVNTIPTTPGTYATTATTACTGGSVSLTTWSTLGTNEAYLWSNSATTQTINPTVTGSYTLRIRNTVTGCTSAASTPAIAVTINPIPGTPNITGANTFCAGGGSTTLTPGTALGANEAYLWSDFSSGNTFLANYAGTFSLRIRNTVTGCTSAVSNAIVVTEAAVPTTVNATGATTVCSGSSTVLTPSRALGTNEAYLWSDNSSASTLSVSTAGTYSVRVRNTVTGCTSYTGGAVTVSVTTAPTAPTITGGTSICSGNSSTLTTTRTLGANEFYLWSTGETTQSISVSVAGTYSLRIRNTATGCTSAASNAITVTTNTTPGSPSIFPLSGTTVCSGTTVLLGTLAFPGTNEERLWSTGETGLTISPTVSGSYTLSIRNTVTGCTSAPSDPINVVINPLPTTPTIAGATSICTGGNTTLTTTATLGTNEAYLWSNNSSASTLSVTAAGTYSLRIRNIATGCTSAVSNTITVSVNALPTTRSITPTTPAATCGTAVTLTSSTSTGNTYQWKLNGTDIPGATSVTYSAAVTGNYAVVAVTPQGCSSAALSNVVTVIVNPTPTTPTIAGATAICTGGNTTLTTTATLGTNEAYLWSNNSTASTLSVTAAGTYSLRIRNTVSGCTSAISNTITVTVNALPGDRTVTPATPAATCETAVLLTSSTSAGNTYQWKLNGVDIPGATSVTYSATTTGNYRVVAVTPQGCTSATASNVVAVTVGTTPTTPTIAGATSICSGSSTTLTTTATLGTNEAYLWSDNSSASTLSVSAAGTYSLRIRNTVTGCTTAVSNTITVTAIALPTTPTIAGATSICSGSSTSLTTTRTLLTNEAYLWSDNSSASTLTVSAAGTYSLRIRNTATGCTSAVSNTITVTVNTLPTTRSITPATPAATCGTAVTLTSSTSTGNTYQWKLNGTDIPGATSVTYSAAVTGNYTVVAVTPQGCSSAAVSNTVAVTVNTVPTTATIAGATSICSGSSTSLTTTYSLGTNEAYLWSDNSSASSLSVSAAGTYSLRIRNTVTGCTSAASTAITVSVNALPTSPTITGTSTICSGSNTTLTTSTTGGNVAYLWSTGETTQSISVSTAGTYTLRIRNTTTGCTSAASTAITVTVNPLPTTRTITPATPAATCGTAVTLTSSTTVGNTYQWKLNGTDIPGATSSTYSARSSGNYTVVAVTSQGCSSATLSNVVAVIVNALPTTPTIAGATSICTGSSTTLTTTRTLLTNEAYLWSDNSSANTLSVSAAGTYSLRVRNTATGCTSAVSNTITVVVNAIPTAPTITGTNYFCSGGSTVLTSTITTGSYLWSNGATSRSITVTAAGDYNVRVITTGCTSAVSSNYTITSLPTGTWLGATTDWTTGSNWCGGNAPGNNTDVTIGSIGLLPVITGRTATCRNLTLAEGRTLALATGVRLTLRGNFSGLGNIVGVSGSELRVRGSANQTIKGLTIGTLNMDNNNPNLTLTLTGNVTVLDDVALTDGVINTGSNYLMLANTTTNPTEIAASYITGNVRTMARNVGTGAISMLGLAIAAGTDNLDTVMIERNETAATFGSNQGINHIWKIRAGNQPISGRQVSLSWNARADNGKSLTSMQVYRRPDIGGEWIRVGGLQSGTTRSVTVTTTSFSDWTVSDAGTPLPVTWASFTGTQTQFGNQLNWSTSSEINNQGFAIERSTDGRNFTKIGFVKGNGTTNAKQHYQFTDSQLLEGYYRLQQLDFDGKTAYSTTIKVGDNVLAKALEVYPNPATDKVTVKTNGVGDLEIVNQVGQVMITQPASEINEINISRLAKGVYTVRFNGSSQKLVVR